MSIRVLVADDQPLVRSGFRMVLDERPDLELVGEASDGREALRLSRELDPVLWFNLVRDESDLAYAMAQLTHDYRDLHDSLGGDPVEVALADPRRQERIKQEALDVMWDADLLRQRSRRLLARACWLYSKGSAFVTQKPAGLYFNFRSRMQSYHSAATALIQDSFLFGYPNNASLINATQLVGIQMTLSGGTNFYAGSAITVEWGY